MVCTISGKESIINNALLGKRVDFKRQGMSPTALIKGSSYNFSNILFVM